MKKIYEKFELVVMGIENEDIVTASPLFSDNENWIKEDQKDSIWGAL